MSGTAIELQDVMVARSGRPILAVDSLKIECGQFVGVVGRNGAGKTTLLHTIAGLIRPSRGAVMHDGVDVTRVSAWHRTAVRRHVAYVPQEAEYKADLPLTVREVVAMGCAGPSGLLRGMDAEARQRVEHWLDRLELIGMARRTFRSLSGGEQQKVLLARAMAQGPRLLLLDEPAANLDMDWKERMVGWLAKVYGERPLTAVMVSHETGLLPACCNRVALMDRGRIVRYGTPAETLTSGVLAELYGCPIRLVDAAGRRHALAAAPELDG